MSKTKPVPVRLTPQMCARLDKAAHETGLGNRAAVIKLCLVLFLDGLEKNSYQLPGVDLDEVVRQQDGRTYRYKSPPAKMAAEDHAEYGKEGTK